MKTTTFATLVAVSVATTLASLPSPAGAVVAPARPTCQGRPATIVGTTARIHGTAGDDVIVVRTTVNTYIRAGAGNDLICGGDGPDFVYDGKGHDRFYGGKGE